MNMYDTFIKNQLTADAIDLESTITHTLKIAFVTGSYNPTPGTDTFWDDISANEVSGTGYTAGGTELSTPSVTLTSTITTYDADDPADLSQNVSGFTNARYAIIYADTGTPGTSRLICYSDDFGVDRGNTTYTLDTNLSVSGIFTAVQG